MFLHRADRLEARRPSQAGRLTSTYAYGDLPPMRSVAVFEEENALPGAQLHPAFCDRNDFARASENGANVRRAVIATLGRVFEPGRILRHEPLEEFLQIAPRGWIGVFRDDEAATGVPNENRNRARLESASSHLCGDLLGDLVSPLAAGRDGKTGGMNAHRLGGRRSPRHPPFQPVQRVENEQHEERDTAGDDVTIERDRDPDRSGGKK